jgi:hypothetical protein
MPIESRQNETDLHTAPVGGFGPSDPELTEVLVDSVTTSGFEETLFDDEEIRPYDLGEGD